MAGRFFSAVETSGSHRIRDSVVHVVSLNDFEQVKKSIKVSYYIYFTIVVFISDVYILCLYIFFLLIMVVGVD
jgi:hypothetical protein